MSIAREISTATVHMKHAFRKLFHIQGEKCLFASVLNPRRNTSPLPPSGHLAEARNTVAALTARKDFKRLRCYTARKKKNQKITLLLCLRILHVVCQGLVLVGIDELTTRVQSTATSLGLLRFLLQGLLLSLLNFLVT